MDISNMRLAASLLLLVIFYIIVSNSIGSVLADTREPVTAHTRDVIDLDSIYGNDTPERDCLLCKRPFKVGEAVMFYVREVNVLGKIEKVFQPCHLRDIYGDLSNDTKEGTN